ncbi:MAG: sulfatase [Opitutaceae bacterium]|nr:sulfatase [Opitutaceae bacterium]
MAFPHIPRLFLAVVVLASTAAAPSARAAADRPRPMNVLFLISDDMRCDLGAYGHALARTPNIDRLARQGVLFERAYTNYPLCCPSRTSMLTGRHPTTTRLYGNREWIGAWHPDWVTLPRHFKNHGYTTLRTGKIFHAGIDDTEAWHEGGEKRLYGDNTQPPPDPATLPPIPEAEELARIERMLAADVARAPSSDRWEAVEDPAAISALGDTQVGDRAVNYLRAHAQDTTPFFLMCGFSKPHSPLVAPKEFFDLYDVDDIILPPDFAARPTVPEGFPRGAIRPINADLFIRRDATPEAARAMIRAYLACISYVDWNVGRVLAELDRLGLRENTIVVFWSDHGYQLGEKGKWSKAGSLWEQGTRVPFIVHDPRVAGNGRASPRVVQAVDIYPTLLDLCGLPRADGIEGLSLAPLLHDPHAPWDHPAFTVWSERNRGLSGVVVRTERWRYAEFFGPGAGAMLTDPLHDPYETQNLAGDPRYAAIVAELSAVLHRYADGTTESTAR